MIVNLGRGRLTTKSDQRDNEQGLTQDRWWRWWGHQRVRTWRRISWWSGRGFWGTL